MCWSPCSACLYGSYLQKGTEQKTMSLVIWSYPSPSNTAAPKDTPCIPCIGRGNDWEAQELYKPLGYKRLSLDLRQFISWHKSEEKGESSFKKEQALTCYSCQIQSFPARFCHFSELSLPTLPPPLTYWWQRLLWISPLYMTPLWPLHFHKAIKQTLPQVHLLAQL